MHKPLSLLFALSLAQLHAADTSQNKPNILFIAVDDLRPELGCYGAKQVISPHLDKLAGQSLRFDRAYCQVPVCGASRASLLTSILPTSRRFLRAVTYADKEVPDAKTLPQVFREAGYTTLSNGKIFHSPEDTEKRSWSEPAWWPKTPKARVLGLKPETNAQSPTSKKNLIYESADVPDNAYPDGKTAIKTIEDLHRLKQAGKPFFLACGFMKPHMPFYAPKKYWDLYEREKISIADNRERPLNSPNNLKGAKEFHQYHLGEFDEKSEDFHRMMRHGYLACTSYTDKLVGDVLAELDRLGLTDNTIVVLWGDHGWQLGEHEFWGKHNTMHLSLRVPLIIRAPGMKPGSTQSLVESSDIFPTLCALASVKHPSTVQGRSFLSLFEQHKEPFRDAVYSRYTSGDCIITDQFTYTIYSKNGPEMLYDLDADPHQNINIAGNTEAAETLKKMRLFLKQRQQEAGHIAD
jgi:iduronate 2-sulfatase